MVCGVSRGKDSVQCLLGCLPDLLIGNVSLEWVWLSSIMQQFPAVKQACAYGAVLGACRERRMLFSTYLTEPAFFAKPRLNSDAPLLQTNLTNRSACQTSQHIMPKLQFLC